MVKPETALTYGNFIQATVDFLIVALSIFLFIQLIDRTKRHMEKKNSEVAATPVAKSAEVLLLEEIRDLLKK